MSIKKSEASKTSKISTDDKSGSDFVWQLNADWEILGFNSAFSSWLQKEKGWKMPKRFDELPLGELRFRYFLKLFKEGFRNSSTFKYIPEEFSILNCSAHLHMQKLTVANDDQDLIVCTYTSATAQEEMGFYSPLQQRLENIIAKPRTWFWSVDNRFRITYLSKNAEKITGHANDDRIGRHLFSHRSSSEQERLHEQWQDLVKRPRPFHELTTTLITKSGKSLTLKATGIPNYSDKGNLKGYSGSVTNITEEIEIHNQLIHTEAKQRAIIDALPDIFLIFNPQGIIEDYHRKEIKNSLGVPEDIVGKSIYDVWPRKQANFLAAPIHRVIETGKIITLNISLPGTDDRQQFYEARYALIEGQEPYVLALLRDVSLSKEAQDQLIKTINDLHFSNRELEQFAYTVSHDLQEPMRLISSYLQLVKMRAGKSLDEKCTAYIDKAIQSSDQMRNLVTNLLQYSRLGNQKLDVSNVNFDEVMESILMMYDKKIKNKKGKVEIEKVPDFVCDPLHFSLLMQNLIGNSLKYSKPDEPPIVRISASDTGEYIKFCVEDNGIGMDSEKANEIFGIFTRLSNTKDVDGHGLGMSICRKIITSHGGKIWVESTPDVGTKIHFTMPKNVDQVPATA